MNKGRILVIDDEDIVRTSCRRMLEPEGYEIDEAKSGSEGISILSRKEISIFVLNTQTVLGSRILINTN